MAPPGDTGRTGQKRREQVLRVFTYLVADAIEAGGGLAAHEIPRRLLDSYLSLTQRFAGLNDEAERILDDAIESGADTIDDLVLEFPPEAADLMRSVAETLDDADYYCWSGADLIDLATPDECVAYRRWCLSQILDQLSGGHPVRWPDSVAARTVRPPLN